MQREQLYHKTVDILKDAYFNDTLQHGNCFACAVGNIVAANCGIKFKSSPMMYRHLKNPIEWDGFNSDVQTTTTFFTGHDVAEIPKNIITQIEKSGYSIGELTKIEEAFESQSAVSIFRELTDDRIDEAMFNGLMKVIEALDIIHENKDEATTQSSKKKFNKETILS